MDHPDYESLKRYIVAIRLKFIVNDPTITAPYVLQTIPDQTPIVGFRDQIVITPATYFSPGCTYMKARQGKNMASTYLIQKTSQLPYWKKNKKKKNTKTKNPPSELPSINIQMYCCNAID